MAWPDPFDDYHDEFYFEFDEQFIEHGQYNEQFEFHGQHKFDVKLYLDYGEHDLDDKFDDDYGTVTWLWRCRQLSRPN